MKLDKLFSKGSDEWVTPQDLFDQLYDEFDFSLDPCANPENFWCQFCITKNGLFVRTAEGYVCDNKIDGLNQEWFIDGACNGNIFMNPPYSEYPIWIKKAYEESQKGCTVVCLIAARTDTKIWQDFIFKKASEIRFIMGRVKFERSDGAKNSAPFPSAIVIFRPPENQGKYKWSVYKR